VKVVQVSTWQVQCGIAAYTEHLCRGLSDHGIEWDVAPIDRELTRYMSRRELREYFAELSDHFDGADIVHIQHEFGFFAGAYHYRESVANFRRVLRAAQQHGRPAFVTLHTVPFTIDWTVVDFSRLPLEQAMLIGARAWWRTTLAPLLNRDAVIVTGRTARRLLIDSGVKAGRIDVIPCGTPMRTGPAHAVDIAAARRRLGLDPDATVLGIFGYLSANKGYRTVLQALERLPERFQLLLAGGPHPNDEHSALGEVLERLEDEPELKGRVALTGYLPESAVHDCLAATDILLAPYRDRTQVSSAALAWVLASGKPVIASRVPVFRELIADSGCAELITPDSPGELALAAQRVADDALLRDALVARARTWCQDNSGEKIAARHAERYFQALGRPVPPAIGTTSTKSRNGSAPAASEPAASAPAPLSPQRPAWPLLAAGGRPVSAGPVQPAVVREAVLPDGRSLAYVLPQADGGDPVARLLREYGYFSDPPLDLALHLLRFGGGFVDVGAHLGTFTLTAAALGCRVLAVEASRANARLLATAIAYNEFADVALVRGAAAASDGLVPFHEDGPFGSVGNGDGALVDAHRLDRLIERDGIGGIALIKLDIEGSELEALTGLGSWLDADDAPPLLLEANGLCLGRRGRTIAELHEALTVRGYALHLLDREHPGRLVRWRPGDVQVSIVADYLAFKREPRGLDPWRIVETFDAAEWVERVRIEAGRPETRKRCYAAAAILCAPPAARDDPQLRATAIELRRDPDHRVAAMIAGEAAVSDYGLSRNGAADRAIT
jgi:FkbM family methyltransferase